MSKPFLYVNQVLVILFFHKTISQILGNIQLHCAYLRFVLFYGPQIRNEFSFLWWLHGLPAYSFYVSHWEVSIESSVRLTVTLVLLMACSGAHLMKCCLTTSMKFLCLIYLRQYLHFIAHTFILSYFVEAQRVKSHIVILSSIRCRNISLPI